MNSISRYYLPKPQWQNTPFALIGDEAHHCSRVLRQRAGDTIEVFDGVGTAVRCQIISSDSSKVMLERVGDCRTQQRDQSICLYQAIPKAGNMELIVQKSVELGVASIQPIITDHTVVRANQKKVEKWQRIALESCKQCGQNWLPEILPVQHFNDWLATYEKSSCAIVAALDPRSEPLNKVLSDEIESHSVAVFIGPEGDLSPAEYDALIDSGFIAVSLGKIILRVETAAIYCLSIIRHLRSTE